MAPSYASIFMDKLEDYIFVSINNKPLIGEGGDDASGSSDNREPEESLNLRQWHRRARPDRAPPRVKPTPTLGPNHKTRSGGLHHHRTLKKRLCKRGHREQETREVTRPGTVAHVPRPDLGTSDSESDTHLRPSDRSAARGTKFALDSTSGFGGMRTPREPRRITPYHGNGCDPRRGDTPGELPWGLSGVPTIHSRAQSSGEGRTEAAASEHTNWMLEVNIWASVPGAESLLLPGQWRGNRRILWA
ncbi:hypothetical protein NDU88_003370 [Pleurodeles waltl]|uniref:Uncharacterized protein n=1 Tax=Pleurodeles waltl TaxID=8319 RepID=A0AAV7T597_PLEWA|nr:hypothetical protein NDU88_003370 [Pleurodeles waltl]